MNGFFASLAQHDPGAFKMVPTLRYTENGAPAHIGGGLWSTAGATTYRLNAVDPTTGQAATMAVLPENGRKIILFARLKVEAGRVTELETVAIRPGEGQMSRPDALPAGISPLDAPLPVGERTSRSTIVAAMNGYLDALATSGTPRFVAPPLADDMRRVENGFQTTGRSFGGRPPKTVLQELRDGMGPPNMPLPSLRVSDRRQDLVDEDAGLGVTIGVMNLDLPPGMPDFPGLHAVAKQNRKQILIEFFKVSGGKVHEIQAAMYDLDDPSHQATGWEPRGAIAGQAGRDVNLTRSAAPAGPPPGMPVPPLPIVTGIASYGQVVADLDRALAFYHDTLGLEVVQGPTALLPQAGWNAAVGSEKAAFRTARLRVPNEVFALDLLEVRGGAATPTVRNHNDVASSFLNLGYVDLLPVLHRLRDARATVVSATGLPDSVGSGRLNLAWIRDPDGHLIEVMNGGWDAGRKSLVGVRNAFRGHFGLTVADHRQALSFYHDALGFDVSDGFPPMIRPGQFITLGFIGGLVGVPPGDTMTGIHGYCAGARCEMFEFTGNRPVHALPSLLSPGESYLALWVGDVDAVSAAVVAHGGARVSPAATGLVILPGDAVWVPQGDRPPVSARRAKTVLARDPSGFLLLLMQPVP